MAHTSKINIELIKKRAITGVITYTFRTFFLQIFTLIATFILTILLDPQVFGIFFVVSGILNLFIYFSDFGLAAALIQKKVKPSDKDLKTTFTIQQIVVFTLVIIGLLFSSKVANFYRLDESGLILLRVIIFSLIFSSLKTIPSILLERQLDYRKFVIPQIAEHVVFYSVAIILAIFDFKLASFAYAVLARGIIGLILMYYLSPWKIGFMINFKSAKHLISFGLPFQTNSILALLKDDLLIVFLGKILPYNQVGYIGWSQKFAFIPLRFIMDNLIKVSFPLYSRLQEETARLKTAIDRSLFFVTFSVYPLVAGITAVAPRAIEVIPGYGKWEGAIPLLYFFAINAIFAAVNTTLTNTLFGIGKPKIILNLMVFWTILTWVLTYILVKTFGYIGVAMASAIVAASTSVTIYFVKKEIEISLIRNISGPTLASFAMFITVKIIEGVTNQNIFGLFSMIATGVISYLIFSYAIYGRQIKGNVKLILEIFKQREIST